MCAAVLIRKDKKTLAVKPAERHFPNLDTVVLCDTVLMGKEERSARVLARAKR